MKKVIVRTGKQEWHVVASSPKDAAIKAFRQKAPKSCGLLTEIEGFNTKEVGPYYMSTIFLLKAAGYEVEDS